MTLPDFPREFTATFGALAFDFGTQRIGLAHGQNVTGTAQPLQVIAANDGVPNWNEVEAVIKKWQPTLLVVGLPYNMDGTRSALCDRAEKFARRLQGRFNLPCYGIDERLSSAAAEELRNPENKNVSKDSLAAQVILETWFNELKSRSRN
ncbi:MAG: Holliday junction resolvase RuvX [Pseudohongiellaceae bacterium]